MNKKLTLLLSLTFLFLFSGSVFADNLLDGLNAHANNDYKKAYKLILPYAEQGHAKAQTMMGLMYDKGEGVTQDYKEQASGIDLLQKRELPQHNSNWD